MLNTRLQIAYKLRFERQLANGELASAVYTLQELYQLTGEDRLLDIAAELQLN